MCLDEKMGIHPYSTLGSGRFQTAAAYAEREKNNPGRKGKPVSEHDKAISAVLERVAKRKATSLTSVSLAYCMAKAPYVFPTVGGRTLEQLKENIEALKLRLSEEDIQEIETGYDFNPGFPHTFLSGSLFKNEPTKGVYRSEDIWMFEFMGTFDWVQDGKAIQPATEE